MIICRFILQFALNLENRNLKKSYRVHLNIAAQEKVLECLEACKGGRYPVGRSRRKKLKSFKIDSYKNIFKQ